MECEKKTLSGKLLEADFYPVWENGSKMPAKPKGTKPSSEAQKKYNFNMAVKRATRLINANFDNEDLLITYTYNQRFAPLTLDGASRDIENYKRRVKTKRAAELKRIEKLLKTDPENKKYRALLKKLKAPFKYYYTIEEVTYKTGALKGKKNYHVHLFMTGGIDRDTAELLWGEGMRVNARRFQPENFGPEAAARYICKDLGGKNRARHSQHLTEPETKKKSGHITQRAVELMAKQRIDDKDYWERRYKGYRFLRCFARFNKYNGHWYVSVVMYKADKGSILPDWKIEGDDWSDTPQQQCEIRNKKEFSN